MISILNICEIMLSLYCIWRNEKCLYWVCECDLFNRLIWLEFGIYSSILVIYRICNEDKLKFKLYNKIFNYWYIVDIYVCMFFCYLLKIVIF